MRRTRLLATAVACCVALLVGACGGGGDSGTSTGSSGGAGPTGEPVAGGHARILMLSDPRSLDPATLANNHSITAVLGNALYGTLMITDDAGEVHYKMAESFTTDDGGQTFELKLRPGLVFSDGTPLNAEAVKFNWDRMKDPANGGTAIGEASMIASTEVVDDRTLKVTMVQPTPSYARAVITTSMNWIASPAALQQGQAAFDENPVGAGPFTLRSWTRQAEIELVRNPKYWDAPKPYLDSITLRAATDANQRYNTLTTGGADIAVETNWLNIAKARQAGLVTNTLDVGGGLFMTLNTRRPPFDDVRARQAVVAAIDIDAINQALYNGTAELADTLFPESSPFYSDIPLQQQDREKAQRLFDELAAEGKPVSFTITAYPSTENRTTAENIQAQLSAYDNVNAEVRIVDFSQVGTLNVTHDYDTITTGAFFQDPDPALWTAFHSQSARNTSGIQDQELDDALLAGRTATTDEERKAAYDRFQRRLVELAPALFFVRMAPSAIAAKNVGGLTQYGHGSLLPEEIWIQK